MNIFRLAGNLTHVFAVTFLLSNIFHTRSCAKISAKSQILYLLVFITRYLDLFSNFVSVYDTAMKIFFIIIGIITVYLICFRYSNSYERRKDSFWVSFLLVPAAFLACTINYEMSVMEILWTFSIYLESVAIVPQLFMSQKLPIQDLFVKKRNDNTTEDCIEEDFVAVGDGLGQYIPIEKLNEDSDIHKIDNVRKAYLSNKLSLSTSMLCHYIFTLGIYRLLFIFNWIYRYNAEGFYDVIAIVGGCVQTLIYVRFFYFYVETLCKKREFRL